MPLKLFRAKPRLPYWLFQLIAIRPIDKYYPDVSSKATIRTEGFIVESVEEQTLVVHPETINYQEKGSAYVGFSLGGSLFIDEPGIVPIQISTSGSFGVKPRRVGLHMLDGWARYRAFRDRIFRLSKATDPNKAIELLLGIKNPASYTSDLLHKIAGEKVVYAVNFWDFWLDEKYLVYIDTFGRSGRAQKGQLIDYSIQMRGLGKPIYAQPKDGLAVALLGYDALWDAAEHIIGHFSLPIFDAGPFTALSGVYGLAETGYESMSGILELLPGVQDVLSGAGIGREKIVTAGYETLKSALGM